MPFRAPTGMAEPECQRFFALSKRVPKDVKRFCGICRQHGVMLETRGHSCQFKDCACTKVGAGPSLAISGARPVLRGLVRPRIQGLNAGH